MGPEKAFREAHTSINQAIRAANRTQAEAAEYSRVYDAVRRDNYRQVVEMRSEIEAAVEALVDANKDESHSTDTIQNSLALPFEWPSDPECNPDQRTAYVVATTYRSPEGELLTASLSYFVQVEGYDHAGNLTDVFPLNTKGGQIVQAFKFATEETPDRQVLPEECPDEVDLSFQDSVDLQHSAYNSLQEMVVGINVVRLSIGELG